MGEPSVPSIIEDAMRLCRDGASSSSTSDIHVEGNEPPWCRVDGMMRAMELPPIEPDAIRAFCEAYLGKREYEPLSGPSGAADGAIQHPALGSVRIHAFRGDNGIALSLRLLNGGIPLLADLGLPPVVASFADFPHGLVLFTGPTGSGKSTALAGLINEINLKYPRHIVTVEDPIEYRHRSHRSLVRQREIGRDVCSYARSLHGVLRADPDVILIGELRDPEVMSACLQAGETGHLVFSTLHTSEAAETVQRIVGVFEGGRQEQARLSFAPPSKPRAKTGCKRSRWTCRGWSRNGSSLMRLQSRPPITPIKFARPEHLTDVLQLSLSRAHDLRHTGPWHYARWRPQFGLGQPARPSAGPLRPRIRAESTTRSLLRAWAYARTARLLSRVRDAGARGR